MIEFATGLLVGVAVTFAARRWLGRTRSERDGDDKAQWRGGWNMWGDR